RQVTRRARRCWWRLRSRRCWLNGRNGSLIMASQQRKLRSSDAQPADTPAGSDAARAAEAPMPAAWRDDLVPHRSPWSQWLHSNGPLPIAIVCLLIAGAFVDEPARLGG